MQPIEYDERPDCEMTPLGELQVGDMVYYQNHGKHFAAYVRVVSYNEGEDQFNVHLGDKGSPESCSIQDFGGHEVPVVKPLGSG
jgi:hypothetical protein